MKKKKKKRRCWEEVKKRNFYFLSSWEFYFHDCGPENKRQLFIRLLIMLCWSWTPSVGLFFFLAVKRSVTAVQITLCFLCFTMMILNKPVNSHITVLWSRKCYFAPITAVWCVCRLIFERVGSLCFSCFIIPDAYN